MPHKDLDIPEYTDTVHVPTITHVCAPEPGLVMYKIYSRYWFFEPTMENWARTTHGFDETSENVCPDSRIRIGTETH
jgi:hypothetical protein